jgi:CDP-diacylglycerol--glycerol-3-phosphate 3-phosphatidyltransferase
MTLTIPNLLTLFRILLIPVLVVVFYLPFGWTHYAAALVFILAALTDWADGWIARRFQQFSEFGAFLDPVADKLTVSTALFLIVQKDPTIYMALTAAVIVGREIAISALREWMSAIGHSGRVKVAWIGKIKTIVQMVAISLLLFRENIREIPVYLLGEVLIGIAAALTLWSGFNYLRAAWPAMRGR